VPEPAARSIWLRPERAARGPVPAFDRVRLAEAGVALADERGLPAVTMRAVAQAVGAAPASLYRYVSTRDELLELMIDHVLAEISYAGLGSGCWQEDLLELARQSRDVQLRHPWLLDATATMAPLGPRAAVYLERYLAALSGLPVDTRTKLEAFGVLNAVVAALSRAELTLRQSGRTMRQWQQGQQEFLAHLVVSGQHPHLAAALATAGPVEPAGPAEPMLDRVVSRVLGGFLAVEPEAPEDAGPEN
jgi:AcrR family transcriptional regulator